MSVAILWTIFLFIAIEGANKFLQLFVFVNFQSSRNY
jgi:hypothetical protein